MCHAHEQWIKVLNNPHFSSLPEALEDAFGTAPATVVREKIEVEWQHLFEVEQVAPDDVREELFGYILPSIAIYCTLRELTDSALDIFRSFFTKAAMQGAEQLRKKAALSPGFEDAFLQSMAGGKTSDPRPSGGFVFQLIRKDYSGLEFHVLQCPYCDYCAKYECSELVPVFCGCDDILYGNISGTLRWGRTRTIGRGDGCCDFRFDRVLP